MKVLYLVSGIGPPAGWGTEFIQELILELSKKGVRATIISPIYKHTHPDWKKWSNGVEKKYGVRIIFLEAPSLIKQSLLIHFALTPLLVTWASLKLLRKEKFDLIHEFSSTPIILLRTFLFNILFHTPTVFTLSVYNNTLLGRLFWIKAFDFAKYYMIPSHELIEKIKSLGVSSKKLVYSPPGINLARFRKKMDKTETRKKLGLPQNKFILVYYGSLTREKGTYDLIEAARLLSETARKRTLITLFAIWKGSSEHQKIKNLIHSVKLPHLKLVEKYVDIPTLLSATDAVILPQQTGHGATIPPISVIEALASGKPVIATDIIGTRELISKKSGRLIPPRNPQALAEAIGGASKIQKELENTLEDFKLENSVNLHLKIYKQC